MTTTTGSMIRGVLREHDDTAMVLAAVTEASETQNGINIVWRPLSGEVVIPMSRVEYWQRALPPELLTNMEV